MNNIFTPERQQNETQVEYRARRKVAKRAVQQMTLVGAFNVQGGINQRRQMRSNMDMQKRTRAYQVLLDHWTQKRLEAMYEKKSQQRLKLAA